PTSRILALWPFCHLRREDSRHNRRKHRVRRHKLARPWRGHDPGGLQYQSIEYIVTKIKSIGMNVIRLTFAIEMVDQIYANNGQDITIQRAFTQALGQANGTRILNQVLAKNPQFTASTTRLQVFDAVAAELGRQQIYVHLDNHISKGMWCCSGTDGNTWWGDTYFNTANWVRGLSYMAGLKERWSLGFLLSEFGFAMDVNTWRGTYANCLASYVRSEKAGWTMWVLAGSYYVREGIQDYDEGWGLLTRDWREWRSEGYVDGLFRGMVRNSVAG
ncbi:uncharacterized protein PODANS_0_1530, partial [Podospora anserina S mat+]